MVDMTEREIIDINDDKKVLTVRRFRTDGRMPFKVGSKLYLKRGRTKERYGQIELTEAIPKALGEMTEADAIDGGYTCADDYINDHLTKFNTEADLDEIVIFYRFKKLWMDAELVNQLRRKTKNQ